ncbi:MAG: histidine phosphatase family protein [Ktedonobacterales bacterium]|nr:histidine phosphatase family protein [Ktedonobacterales bacterium]
MTNLYLIRHGEAFSNVDRSGPVAGVGGDLGLTPHGRLQAERLRDRLATTGEIEPDVLLASTMPRARQTAEIVAPAFGLELIFDEDLHERRPGEADGLPIEEAIARYGDPDVRKEPFRPFSPGGESWATFTLRVGEMLDRVARVYAGQTVVLFTHGGVIDTSFLVFFGMATLVMPQVRFFTYNTSITHWQRGEKEGVARWRLVRYNDDLHVHDIGAEERIRWPRNFQAPDERREAPALPLPTEETGAGK